VLAAFSIESLQFLSPTRHPALSDAVIKAFGALCGIAGAQVALRALGKLRAAQRRV
jgi:VanZ family protein